LVAIPAVCSSCGALFYAPNLVGGTGTVRFTNSRLGPCPVCGGVGDIIDGVYNAATNTARLLISSATKPHQLKKLHEILRAAQQQNLSREEIQETVANELPELQSLRDWLPTSRNELYTFIGIIIALITLITTTALGVAQLNNSVSEQEIQQLVDKAIQKQVAPSKPRHVEKKKKIGRNEACPCGSGKKYKKCCLGKHGT
jgi:hypothetical protein